MTRALMVLWWLLAVLLMPLWLPLAIYTRRTALRLPEAAGANHGCCGAADNTLNLLVIGESTVAGVGVATHEQGLVAHLAQALTTSEQAVCWSAIGENGITARQAYQRLQPLAAAEPADWVVLVFGVNDTTHFSSLAAWRLGLGQLASVWQQRGARVLVTAVPPLGRFTALPWLVRKLFGLRASLLDRALRELAQQQGFEYYAPDVPFEAEYLAEDGYHPSQLGYQLWAQNLAAQLRP